MVLLLISWVLMSLNIAGEWKKLLARFGRNRLLLFLTLYLTGIGGIITGLKLNIEWLLWLSVLLALFANSILVFYSYKKY
jgi:hypothetical protein